MIICPEFFFRNITLQIDKNERYFIWFELHREKAKLNDGKIKNNLNEAYFANSFKIQIEHKFWDSGNTF